MGLREGFNDEEWATLTRAPFWAFAAVAAADGKIDQREAQTLAAAIALSATFKDDLAREVTVGIASGFAPAFADFVKDGRDVLTGLAAVADLLESKAPEHAHGFKETMLLIAAEVAKASGGKFLGFGKKVSREEQVAFALIAQALRYELPK